MHDAIHSKLAVAAVAFGSLWVAQMAHADVQWSVGVPVDAAPVYVAPPETVYVPQVVTPGGPTVYVTPGYGFGSPWEQQRAWQEARWREQQWRERQWREREWRDHEWREHAWREHERDEGRREGHGWRR